MKTGRDPNIRGKNMTGADMRALREANEMTQAEFATVIGVIRETIARAEGKHQVSSEMQVRVELAINKGTLKKVRPKRK